MDGALMRKEETRGTRNAEGNGASKRVRDTRLLVMGRKERAI